MGLFFLQNTNTYSQYKTFNGKPKYTITIKREGVLMGNIKLELFPAIAPRHVANFDSLVSVHFFDSTAFHRVIPGFMIQGGDPNSKHGPKSTWGMGDPSQPEVPAEFSPLQHVRGILSAARDTNINSATSQFFICVASASWLNGLYSIYGKVLSGMNIADSIVNSPRDANDNPLKKIEMFISFDNEIDSSLIEKTILNSPATGAYLSFTNQLLKWDPVKDALMYSLEVATDSLFNNVFYSGNTITTSKYITGLKYGTRYYWRVKATNGGVFGESSDIRNFFVSPTSVHNLDDISKNGLHTISVNATNTVLTVNYIALGRNTALLKITDMAGRLFCNDEVSNDITGLTACEVDISSLPPGLYLLLFDAGAGYIENRKFVVER